MVPPLPAEGGKGVTDTPGSPLPLPGRGPGSASSSQPGSAEIDHATPANVLTGCGAARIIVHESKMYKSTKTSHSATHLPSGKARQDFAETVNRVAYGGERIVLHRRGRNLAALIPLEDLALLEELEDRQDAEDAQKALAEAKAKGEKPVPWPHAKKKLGL